MEPATFDLDEIEHALLEYAEGRSPQFSYHRFSYAWEALKRCGHRPSEQAEQRMKAARQALIDRPKELSEET